MVGIHLKIIDRIFSWNSCDDRDIFPLKSLLTLSILFSGDKPDTVCKTRPVVTGILLALRWRVEMTYEFPRGLEQFHFRNVFFYFFLSISVFFPSSKHSQIKQTKRHKAYPWVTLPYYFFFSAPLYSSPFQSPPTPYQTSSLQITPSQRMKP